MGFPPPTPTFLGLEGLLSGKLEGKTLENVLRASFDSVLGEKAMRKEHSWLDRKEGEEWSSKNRKQQTNT